MRRVYIRYQDWEDYQNGMWRRVDNEDDWLKQAIEFTGNYRLYGKWMNRVIWEWGRTMLNNLTNPSMNHRAFVGHCACCLAFGCPEYIVRRAWKELTDDQRELADNEAQLAIDKWKDRYRNILKNGNPDVTMAVYQMRLL